MRNIKDRVIMYNDNGVEMREFLIDEEQERFIIENFDNVEIYTIEECQKHGLGIPSWDCNYEEGLNEEGDN